MTRNPLRVWGTTLGLTLATGLIACSGHNSAAVAPQTPDEYCAQAAAATEKIDQSERSEPFEYTQQLMLEAEEALTSVKASAAVSRSDTESAGLDMTIRFAKLIREAESEAAADAAIEAFYADLDAEPDMGSQVAALSAHLNSECGINLED